jgi:hypothetical protein
VQGPGCIFCAQLRWLMGASSADEPLSLPLSLLVFAAV